MRHFFRFALVVVLMPLAHIAEAQQAKAYERVIYMAQQNANRFQLTYADGYIAASQIRLKQGSNTCLFIADSGTPETDGSFRFSAQDGSARFVVLKNLDETIAAPRSFHAVYNASGQTWTLLFIKKK